MSGGEGEGRGAVWCVPAVYIVACLVVVDKKSEHAHKIDLNLSCVRVHVQYDRI